MPALDYSTLADIYDLYVRTELDVPFFLDEAKHAGGTMLELMCGTGRLSLALARAGMRLTCVDSSPEMLAVMRGKFLAEGLECEAIEQDVCSLRLGRTFPLVVIPFHSFSEITDPFQQQAALAAIVRHMTPDGRLIITLHNPSVRLKSVTGGVRRIGSFPMEHQGGALTVELEEHADADTAIVSGMERFTATGPDGSVLWKRELPIRFRNVTEREFRALAESAGLAIESVFGDYARAPYDPGQSPFMIFALSLRRADR